MLVNNEQLAEKLGGWPASLRHLQSREAFRDIVLPDRGKGVHRFWVDCDKKLAYISTEMEGYLKAMSSSSTSQLTESEGSLTVVAPRAVD